MVDVSVNVFSYSDHVLLELIVDDGDGNVTANSLEFDLVDSDSGKVVPAGDLPPDHGEVVRRELRDAGYAVDDIIPA